MPAPTKTIRPPLRSACVMMSTPTAMRSFSRCTAASILRSSFSIPSTMSAAESLSMASVDGIDRFGGKRLPLRTHRHAQTTSGRTADVSIARSRDRRLSRPSARRAAARGPHARELRARPARRWPRSPPARARAVEALDRRGARGVRPPADGARAVAAIGRAGGRRHPRLLPLPRARSAARRTTPPTTCGRRAPGRRCRSFSRSRKSTR